MTTTIDLGGLRLLPRPDESKSETTGWYFTSLEDWYSISDSKTEIRERPIADGAFRIARDWRTAATPSIVAVYIGVDDVDTTRAKQEMRRLLGNGIPVQCTVTDPLGPTSRTVSIRFLKVNDDHARRSFTMSVDMLAADPNRYGPVVTASTTLPTSGGGLVYPIVYPIDYGAVGNLGRVTVTNPGTAMSYSVMSVTGGLSGGFELREVSSGNVLRFERVVPLGSTVYLNPRTSAVYIDDPANDVSGSLTRREWWGVPPGATQEIQFNSIGVVTGTPLLTAATPAAY